MQDTENKIIQMPDFPELTFDETSHIYRLDGDVIPSVSEIMTPLSTAKYKGISDRTLNNAANKGSAVHDAIEFWIKYGVVDIEKEHAGYFNAFLRWWEKEKPVVIGSENRVYHPILQYGGTVDLYCLTGQSEPTLVDYKCTYQLSEMTCRVQLEAYSQALASHDLPVMKKNILHLKKDETYEYRPFLAKDPVAWRVFGNLKGVYDYLKSYQN